MTWSCRFFNVIKKNVKIWRRFLVFEIIFLHEMALFETLYQSQGVILDLRVHLESMHLVLGRCTVFCLLIFCGIKSCRFEQCYMYLLCLATNHFARSCSMKCCVMLPCAIQESCLVCLDLELSSVWSLCSLVLGLRLLKPMKLIRSPLVCLQCLDVRCGTESEASMSFLAQIANWNFDVYD